MIVIGNPFLQGIQYGLFLTGGLTQDGLKTLLLEKDIFHMGKTALKIMVFQCDSHVSMPHFTCLCREKRVGNGFNSQKLRQL
jgi:hypothetical protein